MPAQPASARRLTVATLNLYGSMGDWETRAPLLVEQFAALQPDIMGVQEVDAPLDQDAWLAAEASARLAAQPGYAVKRAVGTNPYGNGDALALISRVGFAGHEALDLMTFDRLAPRAEFRIGTQAFAVVNTHLHYPLESAHERAEQAAYLLAWLDSHVHQLPTVVLGDFNAYAHPPEPAVQLMTSRFRSAYAAVHGHEPERTWPTPVGADDPSPPGTLDYIFVSSEWHVRDAGLAFDRPAPNDPRLYPSDHLGVFAVLELA
jgi:endonuclease/exonuclease/phosphatase family metal-dependent hydrolase